MAYTLRFCCSTYTTSQARAEKIKKVNIRINIAIFLALSIFVIITTTYMVTEQQHIYPKYYVIGVYSNGQTVRPTNLTCVYPHCYLLYKANPNIVGIQQCVYYDHLDKLNGTVKLDTLHAMQVYNGPPIATCIPQEKTMLYIELNPLRSILLIALAFALIITFYRYLEKYGLPGHNNVILCCCFRVSQTDDIELQTDVIRK